MIENTAYMYYRKNSNKIVLELPAGGRWVRPFLKKALSERHKIEWDGAEKVWLISKSPENFDKVLNALRTKYSTVVTEVEHSKEGYCTSACQEAKHQHCECVCAGMGHGGNADYKPSQRGVLEYQDIQVVSSTYSGLETPQKAVQDIPKPLPYTTPKVKSFAQVAKENPGPEGFDDSYDELLGMLGRSEFEYYFG